jgi:hypothetical protein
MIGRHLRVLAPSERADEAMAILEKLRRGERVHRYDTVRVTRTGRRIDVSHRQ